MPRTRAKHSRAITDMHTLVMCDTQIGGPQTKAMTRAAADEMTISEIGGTFVSIPASIGRES